MLNNPTIIWIAIIGSFIAMSVVSILLAGMYDSLKMRVKNLERD